MHEGEKVMPTSHHSQRQIVSNLKTIKKTIISNNIEKFLESCRKICLRLQGRKICLNKILKVINHEGKENPFLLHLSDFILSNLSLKLAKRGTCPHAVTWQIYQLHKEIIIKYIVMGFFAHCQYIKQFRLPFIKGKGHFPQRSGNQKYKF